MHNTTATEPTWITAARAATAEQRAAEAERQRQRIAERDAADRRAFFDLLRQCGVPVDRADVRDQAPWGWVAVVDGYQFCKDGWALRRLVTCPACTATTRTSVYAGPSLGEASLGELLDAEIPFSHRCPGRPVGPEDYDEEGELIDRTPRPAPPPPPPSTGERLLAALAEYIAEQGAGE